ncbi:hypothetical protein [Actinoplanes sp. NPDC023714]|uniref:hypothetical protein n=1 Tax=Actinoplanes sp. NPDC023714 TaxID=3154322 RepID=UPI0033C37B64
MAFYGDPDELDRLAAGLRAKAARIRDDAAAHEARGRTARWVSDGATAYREQLARDRAETDRRAEGIEHAAALLVAHADEVRQALAAIARIEKQVTDWFADQKRALTDLAGGVLRRVTGNVPWVDWPIGPDSLPEPGDVRWLEVGRFMSRQGAL